MNQFSRYYFNILLKKEYLDLIYSNIRNQILFFIIYVVSLTIPTTAILNMIKKYYGNPSGIIIFNYYILFLPIMAILLASIGYLSEAFFRERIEGGIEALLALPINIIDIWLSKIIIIFLYSYLMYVSTISILFLIEIIILKNTVFLSSGFISLSMVVNMFLVSPLLSLSILSILGYLALFIRDGRYINLSIMAMTFIMFYLAKFISPYVYARWKMSFIMSSLALLLFLLALFLTARLSKEKMTRII